jgi:hypothetical protein
MSKYDDDPIERARVYSKLGPLVMDYHDLHAGRQFHSQDLHEFVQHYEPNVAPESVTRCLRQLRENGKLDYVVLSRRRSLYQFRALGANTPRNPGHLF